jgi:Icc-related predicted phosphoesterase
MQEINISVYGTVGSSFCVEADDGQKIYNLIEKSFKENKKILLSFQNVEMITTAFFNTAIGQLYRDFSEEEIKDNLSVENILPTDIILLKRVVPTAKLYYQNPERMQKSINEILEEE